MAVAKRRRRGKPTKIEQRKVGGPEWGPQVKQTLSWLVQFTYGRLSGRRKKKKKKHIKRGAKIELERLFIFLISVRPPSCLEDVFFFACQIKLSCNTGSSVVSNFCCSDTEQRKWHAPLTSMVPWLRFNLAKKNLNSAPVRWKTSTKEAQISKSSNGGSWTWRKPSTGAVTRSPEY